MPYTFPGITFNDNGVCNFCQQKPLTYKKQGKDKLLKLMKSVKHKGKYDCVVPLSGGKDSTHILFYAKRKMDLKPIAVNYDSGFQSETARRNVRITCKALNIPLHIKGPKASIQEKIIREILLVSEGLV